MLPQLKELCKNCTLCRLGREKHEIRGEKLDPHVFSNMIESKFVIIAQNPGYHECKKELPLVGQAGQKLDKELAKHDIDRSLFYITNTVHCHTPNNRSPLPEEFKACRSIISMELNYLQPELVITLGKPAFQALCPDENYSQSLGMIKKSKAMGRTINVFPIYHPSGMNLAVKVRKQKFEEDIEKLCKLIKTLKQSEVSNEI